MKTSAATPPPQLRQFQEDYSRHLRAPAELPLPDGVPPRRSQVYEELLFNNVCGFIDRCFPVARRLLEAAEWCALSRDFYRDWPSHTPYFSCIPHEFVQYVQQLHDRQPWFAELIDYEWRELAVELHPRSVPRVHLPPAGPYALALNPTLQNLQYRWPVHRISRESIPAEPAPTFLLVYRDFEHRVQFMEINAATSVLLQLLQEGAQPPHDLLDQLAAQLPQIPKPRLLEFGRPLLEQLLLQNILLVE